MSTPRNTIGPHALWMGREIGAGGLQALQAIKERLDPVGIMNPGKVLGRQGR